MPTLRVAFFGTPEFAIPTLSRLLDAGFPVVAAVTQPDRPRGRGQKPSPGPVKLLAAQRGIPVLQPERLRHEDFLRALAATAPDIGVVAAYGKILPEPVLSLPPLGLVNVHASLLPRWRGASPVHRAVMAGDAETGVSIMRIVKELDAGAVFAMARRAIGPEETSGEVERDLALLGAGLLPEVLASIQRGDASLTPQDSTQITYAPLLTKEEGRLDWREPAAALHNRIRGLHPWPHAFTFLRGARVIVLRSLAPDPGGQTRGAPGEILAVHPGHLEVATGAGTLRVTQLQAEGRRALPAREFSAGVRLAPGARFET
jgi:methionyl-tRNA formyltransferase